VGISTIAIRVVGLAPRAVTPLVRLWAWRSSRSGAEPHWLLARFRSELGIRNHAKCRLLTGQTIVVDPLDSIGSEIRRNGCYEPDTVALLGSLLEPGSVYVDVGAHVGHHVLIGSARVGPEGRVYAFEADPLTFRELSRNVKINHCNNVTLNNVALADSSGQATFFLADVSLSAANSLGKTAHTSEKNITVNVSTLDDYFAQCRPSRVDVIKADVEGAELLVVRGAVSTLRRYQPFLVLEFSRHSAAFNYASRDLARELRAMQFELFRVAATPLQEWVDSEDDGYYNVLAAPACRVAELREKKVLVSRG
jgi:FkbM family methyltransferase